MVPDRQRVWSVKWMLCFSHEQSKHSCALSSNTLAVGTEIMCSSLCPLQKQELRRTLTQGVENTHTPPGAGELPPEAAGLSHSPQGLQGSPKAVENSSQGCRTLPLTQRLAVKVNAHGARNGVGHNQRGWCQVVGTDTVTQAALKVLCARQHSAGNDLTLQGTPTHSSSSLGYCHSLCCFCWLAQMCFPFHLKHYNLLQHHNWKQHFALYHYPSHFSFWASDVLSCHFSSSPAFYFFYFSSVSEEKKKLYLFRHCWLRIFKPIAL